MKKSAYGLLFSIPGALGLCGCAAKYSTFGESLMTGSGESLQVSNVLRQPDKYAGKNVRVSGRVVEVCAHKGCWITVADPGSTETVFVKFTCPVEGRLVPVEARGHTAIVEGEVQVEEVPEDQARHEAEEGGKSAAEIARIVGPQTRVRLMSPGARIEGL